MANLAQSICPVCSEPLSDREEYVPGTPPSHYFDCPNCGQFNLCGNILAKENDHTKAILSHAIWRRQSLGKCEVDSSLIDSVRSLEIPNPAEQLALFIIYLGSKQDTSGSVVSIRKGCLRAKIGGLRDEDEEFIVGSAVEKGYFKSTGTSKTDYAGRLTLDGWEHFQELKKGVVKNRRAFMAMPFGCETLDKFVNEIFRPAVQKTGFDLRRVDDEPKAGLIDDKIRVEIRNSRFVVVDLTCENRGAYWEAGFAEGLGKPVIYTCNCHYFSQFGTHFDTNHHQTVIWDPDHPENAAESLKATIRATLPFEAKMEDD